MKYTPKELKGNVNVSRTSPVREFVLLSTVLLCIIFIIYIFLGFVIDFVVPKVPPEIEKNLGRMYSRMYGRAEKTNAGIRLQQILDELVDQLPGMGSESNLTEELERQEVLKYEVNLIPDSQINAMALPGRNIVVYSGLIKEVESENELAFILAHELGHFAHRDHLRGLGRGLVLLTVSTTLLGGDSVVTEFLMNSLLNVEMKFSQHQEKIADLWALDLLNRRYGHVSGVTDFFDKMLEKEKKGRILYYFATHPYPKDRIEALEEKIQRKGYLRKEKIPLDGAIKEMSDFSDVLR